jgi:hypothetical protein
MKILVLSWTEVWKFVVYLMGKYPNLARAFGAVQNVFLVRPDVALSDPRAGVEVG